MKIKFDELGIEIPYPHTTLFFGEDKSGNTSAARFEAVTNSSAASSSKTSKAKTSKAAPIVEKTTTDDDGD